MEYFIVNNQSSPCLQKNLAYACNPRYPGRHDGCLQILGAGMPHGGYRRATSGAGRRRRSFVRYVRRNLTGVFPDFREGQNASWEDGES